MCDIKSLTKKCGENNPPGTRAELFLIPSHELINQPATKADNVVAPAEPEPGDSMILDEPFEYVDDPGIGYWRKYSIITDTGELKDTQAGEVGGRSFENSVSFSIAGTDADHLEFAKCVSNGCFVAMIRDRKDKARVIGRYDDPAFIQSIEITSGVKSGDRKGGAYVLQTTSGAPMLEYDIETHGINEVPNV